MGNSENGLQLMKRRTVLQLTSLGGGLGMLSSSVSANTDSNNSNQIDSDRNTQILGDFESSLDGWKTSGGTDLELITDEEIPTGVARGSRGLLVDIHGDMHPMIENKQHVSDANFVQYPHLQMHALATAEATDSNLQFTFRLHHTAGLDGETGEKGTPRSRDEMVVESDLKEVPQLRPVQIGWNLSEVSEAVLDTAHRLEIVWYLEDHPPEGGQRGREEGDFDYQGIVVFDDIRLFESPPVSEEGRLQDKKLNLSRAHGMRVNRIIDERSEEFERGSLEYSDGFSVSYTFEEVGDERFEYTIGGETFQLGGGWE